MLTSSVSRSHIRQQNSLDNQCFPTKPQSSTYPSVFVLLSEPTRILTLRPLVSLKVVAQTLGHHLVLNHFLSFVIDFLPTLVAIVGMHLEKRTLSGHTQTHEARGIRALHNTSTAPGAPREQEFHMSLASASAETSSSQSSSCLSHPHSPFSSSRVRQDHPYLIQLLASPSSCKLPSESFASISVDVARTSPATHKPSCPASSNNGDVSTKGAQWIEPHVSTCHRVSWSFLIPRIPSSSYCVHRLSSSRTAYSCPSLLHRF